MKGEEDGGGDIRDEGLLDTQSSRGGLFRDEGIHVIRAFTISCELVIVSEFLRKLMEVLNLNGSLLKIQLDLLAK